MIYPSIVVAVAISVVAIIMIFVIPMFAKMFGEMGLQLPLPTRITIALSNFMVQTGIFIVLGIIGFFIAVKFYRRTDNGKKVTDAILLKIPLLGVILLKSSFQDLLELLELYLEVVCRF